MPTAFMTDVSRDMMIEICCDEEGQIHWLKTELDHR